MDPLENAVFISSLIPWLTCREEIMDYMSTIPQDQQDLTLQLTLKHFFASKDESSSSLSCEILGEAIDISRVFPNFSHKEITSRLLVLGNIPNRKEVVLRQLLQKENSNLLASTSTLKRNHCGCNNETDINIKIRKLDGALKIITHAKQTTSEPQKVHPGKEIPSSNSINAIPEIINIDSDSLLRDQIRSNDDYLKGLQLVPPRSELGMSQEKPSVNDSMAYMDYILEKNFQFIESLGAEKDNPHFINSFIESEPLESSKRGDDITGEENDANSFSGAIRSILGWEDHIDLPTNPSSFHQSRGSADTIIQDICENVVEEKSVPSFPASRKSHSHSNSGSSDTIIQDIYENVEGETSRPSPFPSIKSSSSSSSDSSSSSLTSSSMSSSGDSIYSDWYTRSPEFQPDYTFIDAEATPRPLPKQFNKGTRAFSMETERNDRKRKVEVNQRSVYKEAGPSTVTIPPAPSTVTIPPAPKLPKTEDDSMLVARLSEMFPETCTKYIRQLCQGKHWNHFEEIVEIILENPDHPKQQIKQRVISPPPQISKEDQLKIVKEILPDADPTFLEIKCENFNYKPELIAQFLEECRERKNYPTLKDYLRQQQLSAQSKQYTVQFDIEKFIELFPDPEKTFSDPTRKVELNEYSKRYIKVFFENKFNKLHKRSIQKALNDNDFKILKTDADLQHLLNQNITMKSQRKKEQIQQTEQNILILQELAYVTHKDDILHHIEMKKKQMEQKRQYAKDNGLMNTCSCCYNDEVMPEDTYYCPKEHPFCGECIETSCGIALGDGRTEFKCLAECTEEFPLSTLQKVLPPKMFSNLARKQALAEIKAAGLDNLEMCPFCDFASIPSPQDKVFRCLNPECMKESCRECKEPSHLPLRCDEIEKDEHVKARTHIENKMTEALLRKCCKCGTSFFKEEGCNKMTCPCGAVMCYICNKPVEDYKHFNGIGGDKIQLCPLYSDTNELNKVKVLQAAQVAKQEVASELKVDPTVDIEQHFEQRRRVLGTPPYLNVLRQFPLDHQLRHVMRAHHRHHRRHHVHALGAVFPNHHNHINH